MSLDDLFEHIGIQKFDEYPDLYLFNCNHCKTSITDRSRKIHILNYHKYVVYKDNSLFAKRLYDVLKE